MSILLENIDPAPQDNVIQLAGAVTEFSKGHSTVLLSHLPGDGGKHNETSEFHEYRAIATIHVL